LPNFKYFPLKGSQISTQHKFRTKPIALKTFHEPMNFKRALVTVATTPCREGAFCNYFVGISHYFVGNFRTFKNPRKIPKILASVQDLDKHMS